MPQQMPTSNPDDERTDLEAMLAASRELGPDMDKALVDSYMSRNKTQTPPAPPAPRQPGQSIMPWGGGMRYIGFAVLAGSLILAAIFSTVGSSAGHGFWFPWFFLPWLFFLMFARRGMYRSRRTYTYTDENGQEVNVRERYRGYGPGYSPYRGPYGSNTPYGTRPGYGPSDRVDPDGRPAAPNDDAATAADLQSKYGAPDSSTDAPSQYRPRYATDDREQHPGD